MRIRAILTLLTVALLVGCSATRYVAQSSYLLSKNKVNITADEKRTARQISKSSLEDYIQQRPNRRFLGVGLYLGLYNITDTAKHGRWHKFWGEKMGDDPVILDSSMVRKSSLEMEIYLDSQGFINSSVTDTITVNRRRKATVTYNVNLHTPYRIKSLRYDIADSYIRELLKSDTISPTIKVGEIFERKDFEDERVRLTGILRNKGFWGFNASYITYTADTTQAPNSVDVVLNLRRLRNGQDAETGEPTYENHPIYRIADVGINTAYNPSLSVEQMKDESDTIIYKDLDIFYKDKLYIRPDIISDALGIAPGVLYDQNSIQQSYNSVRSLGYSANILFSIIDTIPTRIVYSADSLTTTTERALNCLVQCTPSDRQSWALALEASTTSDYFSTSLTASYENRNLFGGAEDFNISFRGAYEFNKAKGSRNSFEFGVTTSLALPRFLLPISAPKMRNFKYSSTKLSLSYNIQNRPFYRRSLFSAVYGYSWTLKSGARFTINPADINVVDVPWINEDFRKGIENPYLKNSYEPQLIAGASATYLYNTNSDTKQNGTTFRMTGDVNGNLFNLISVATNNKSHYKDNEKFYNLFGLRYAQYVRFSGDISRRINIGRRSQIAWRVLGAAGFAYGNSAVLPFERMFFAGGSNSMRGWQVRTLGPGGAFVDSLGTYPNQLGDIRLEANFEYRVNVVGGVNMALFLDCGNIWFNGKGEPREDAKFKFSTFYKQLALNTGVGIRYDLGYFLIRLDWGFKLHNPNAAPGQRWFKHMGLKDTALNFALGLPF